MINIIGDDVFGYIALFLHNYKDLLSLSLVNTYTYYYDYNNKEIELSSNINNIKFNKIKKLTLNNLVVSIIPEFVKKIIMNECTTIAKLNMENLTAVHIKDCLTYHDIINTSLTYSQLKAVYLYNFTIDPDDFNVPNLEYLFIYESDDDYEYVYLFDIFKIPKLKYLDIKKVYIHDQDTVIENLEYYKGYYFEYKMPKLKYLETDNLKTESEYLSVYPNLTTIITFETPTTEFNHIKIIQPDKSKIALEYYKQYF